MIVKAIRKVVQQTTTNRKRSDTGSDTRSRSGAPSVKTSRAAPTAANLTSHRCGTLKMPPRVDCPVDRQSDSARAGSSKAISRERESHGRNEAASSRGSSSHEALVTPTTIASPRRYNSECG